CKRKERGKVLKTSCSLTRAQADLLVNGTAVPDISGQDPVLRKLTLLMMTRGMRPVIIVDYDRFPFICSTGNVRVTLDMNLSSSSDVRSFFDGAPIRRPVLPAGQHLLEVKYDEFLPDQIYRSLQLDNLTATAFSKYYLCRKYTV
nr:VTC domain-containing protein [Clostridiales bacterium]